MKLYKILNLYIKMERDNYEQMTFTSLKKSSEREGYTEII